MTRLSSLIAPLTLPELDEHWNRSSLLLPRRGDRFAALAFDAGALGRELRLTETPVRAQFVDARGEHREMPIDASQMESCVAAGMTVCVVQVDAFLPALAAQTRELNRSIRFPGSMNFSWYWSPSGAGFGLHYDNHAVFICQLSGRKRWWYGRTPAVASPRMNLVYSPERVAALRASGVEVAEPDALEEVVLEPGDMLYLPPGCWHRTSAVDGESSALTLRVFDGTVEHVVHHTLQSFMVADDRWRQLLPLVDDATTDPRLPASLASLFDEQLAKLRAYVDGLTVADLARTWAELQVHAAPPRLPGRDLAPGDRVALRRGVRILRERNARGDDCLFVYTGAAEHELPIARNAWFDRLVAAREFAAARACEWEQPALPWSEASRMLEELIEDGIVEVLPAQDHPSE